MVDSPGMDGRKQRLYGEMVVQREEREQMSWQKPSPKDG